MVDANLLTRCDVCGKKKPINEFANLIPRRGKISTLQKDEELTKLRIRKIAKLFVPQKDYPDICHECIRGDAFKNA